jgi:hypothetical protein
MKNYIYKLILVSFVVIIAILVFKGYSYKKEVNKNGETTVAKFFYYKNFPKTKDYYFKYFVKGETYINSYGQTTSGFHENKGKFYEIKYSKKEPNKLIVNFDKEITDTTLILKAGFSKEDIENMPTK